MADVSTGLVFNIQHFSVHDGDGIRTVIFFKGCPLSCKWCSNPESQGFKPQLALNASRCLGAAACDLCVDICPQQAITHGEGQRILHDRNICQGCFSCVSTCPANAFFVYGEEKTIDELIEHVDKDALFYQHSGGGMTLSGGEVMAQPKFAIELLKKATEHRVHTAIETSCLCKWEDLEQACTYLNLMICDIKHLDDDVHLAGTGVSNKLILNNIKMVLGNFPFLPVLVRTPIIPGFNDNVADIQAIVDFLPRQASLRYELLPYHSFGAGKYKALEMDNPFHQIDFDEKCMAPLQRIANAFNAEIVGLFGQPL